MRVSELLIPTLRETPAEAEIASHKLLLRAGFIRKTAAGIYTYLPLGMRVLRKIMNIIREEMDRQGGQEMLMPVMQPAELWLESGRWHVYGPELMRFKDRHNRDFCLGPTHEEVITALMRGEIKSYKQLPQLLYHIGNKYRDERRPRFGLMRGREFIMKDLYSFDRDEEGLDKSYQKMYEAYTNVFKRCGLTFRPVEADSGAIGGSTTHEFMVLAESGEATILYCDSCDYAANVEKVSVPAAGADPNAEKLEIKEVSTPGAHTVEQVAEFLDVEPHQIIKTLIYKTDQETVAALVRGDREINEVKLYNALNCLSLELADAKTVEQVSGAPVGYAGPVNLKGIRIIADPEVAQMTNAVTGANKGDAHFINVNPGRDFKIDMVEDIRLVAAGEKCPKCDGRLLEAKGIEVGQIFKLGDKYSKVLKAHFLDEDGREKPIIMGCYGIGVGRTMAAAVEQNHDENGIIWPVNIAPYHVVVIPINVKDEEQFKAAENIYNKMVENGIEAVIDDRKERPGVKFKDADLIGYPLRVVVGKKATEENVVEVYNRRTGETVNINTEDVLNTVQKLLFARA
ncbi:prolyl-tRNA synthetase [Desulfohalotomaculum tongense]|uniref:proline--tRNA ligase n=1 Tax=Desulforadius tongensis TaxID=1216062 RepID=UPI0019599C2F|nr:proline--tRNA ligase [Desulforadius tongensis]MBM7854432.1 prolyl-tRNA synthetase [Desulforadius tongensis]